MENNKVTVITKAKPFGQEEYVDVLASNVNAEKWLRKNVSQYIKKTGAGEFYFNDDKTGNVTLYFARSTEVKTKV